MSIRHLLQVRRLRSDCSISVAADLGLADCPPADAVDAPQCAKSPRQGSERLGEAAGIEEQRRLARQPRAAQRPDLAPDIATLEGMDLLIERNAAELHNAEHQPTCVDAIGYGPA